MKRSALLTAIDGGVRCALEHGYCRVSPTGPYCGAELFHSPTKVGDAQRPRDTLVVTKAMVASAQRHIDAAKRKAVFGSGRVPSTVEVPVYANIIKGRHVRDRLGHSRERVSVAQIKESIVDPQRSVRRWPVGDQPRCWLAFQPRRHSLQEA
ncbi:MAG: hypothetical protein V9E81_04030 [Marmoricola sp.]